jgi:4-nitrophenyl phosphatase
MTSPIIKSLVIDMDGVLWKGDTPIGDLSSIFSLINKLGLKVVFATNNGTRTPEQYVERFTTFGVRIDPWQVVTSALCVAHLLKERYPNGGPIFAIGETGVVDALQEQGFSLVTINDTEKALAVVIGLDRKINFEKMREATLLVRRGLPFYATNDDKTFPTPRGEIPGAGAWLSVIITATGKLPVIAGKPSAFLIEMARERVNTLKSETLIIGDRLETDIAAGQRAGCPTALVLSGVCTSEMAENWNPQPDYISENLEKLILTQFSL